MQMPLRRIITGLVALLLLAACATASLEVAQSQTPPTGRMLTVNGHRVHAHVEGRGPDVILLHGGALNSRDMTFDLAGRLAGDYRVIAFDRPGLGYSAPIGPAGDTAAGQAAHLDAAAARLGVRRAVLVGHSYGGAVALAWALDHPERVAAVVVLSGASMPWPEGDGPPVTIASTDWGSALLSALLSRRSAERILDRVFAPQATPEGYLDYLGVDLTLNPTALRASSRQIATLKGELTALAPRYPGLDLPVELVHGTADRFVPVDDNARALAARLPDAHLTELSGLGHMIHHVAPRATRAAIDRAAARGGLR